jgi:hypothetical protein
VPEANEAAADIEEVQAWAVGLDALHARIAPRFARAEPRRRVLAYLRGLLGNVGRKNGWQLAEHAGERSPDGMQRLLATADWDPELVRDDLRGYVVEHLGDPGAVLVVDETGFLKKGTTSVGVQRQYSGTAGKVDNCQLGVFLAYASATGRAFIDRELYLPRSWTNDPGRCRAARVPEQVGFRTKPQLARVLLERALDAGVPASWVTADEVYGGDPVLRCWLEDRGVSYVLAVKGTEPLGTVTQGSATAAQLAASMPVEQWVAASAGHGARGAACMTGHGSSWPRRLPAAANGGCWCAAAAATGSWPSTPATARAKPPCSAWFAWPGRGGRWRKAFSRPRVRSAWTTTRCAAGRAGTGTSPWPCWPTPSWWSPAPRPPPAEPRRGPAAQSGIAPHRHDPPALPPGDQDLHHPAHRRGQEQA